MGGAREIITETKISNLMETGWMTVGAKKKFQVERN